jgi:CheY-like chemotaxis protein
MPSVETRLKCLVIDDHPDAADSLAILLRAWGHEAHVAYDGENALAVVSPLQPDVVFLDLVMPGLNGLTVAAIMQHHVLLGDAVLIAMSGRAGSTERKELSDLGISEFLLKPIEPERLKDILTRIASQATN